jgi:excisionase family DNA binding protein
MNENLQPQPVLEPVLASINATCECLDLSDTSVYRLIGQGKLKAVKAGIKTLITVQSIKAYVASLPQANIKPPVDRMKDKPGKRGVETFNTKAKRRKPRSG